MLLYNKYCLWAVSFVIKAVLDLLKNDIIRKTILSVLTALISFIVYKVLSKIIFGRFEGDKINKLQKGKQKTYVNLFKNFTKYFITVLCVIIILRICGVNVTSLVAGIGIVGAVIGLAVQDWLKDIIRGGSILSDDYYAVGDVVKYKDVEAKVHSFGLRTTKIKELATGNIISIANRNIDEITLVSENSFVTVPMPYEVNVEKAEEIINDIISRIKSQKDVKDCINLSVKELNSSSVDYYLNIKCNPAKKLQIIRDANKNILLSFEEYGISVPYQQIDIHTK